MSQRNLVTVLIAAFVTVWANAGVTVCKKGAGERKIEVTYGDAEKKTPPCEVKYTKEGDTEAKTLWKAQNGVAYCEDKAKEFAGKLAAQGYNCGGDEEKAAPAADAKAPAEGETKK